MSSRNFLLLASYGESLLKFRGALILALQNEGFTVHVAAPDLTSDSVNRKLLMMRGVVVHEIPLDRTGYNIAADVRTCYYLWRLIRAISPCLLLSYTIKPIVYGSLVGFVSRVPNRFALVTGLGYVFGTHGTFNLRRRLVTLVSRSLYFLALRLVNAVFLQNSDDEKLLRSRGLIGKGVPSIVVNGSGVDLDYYAATPVMDKPLRFLLIARLLGSKGVREYVAAARRIKHVVPEAEFALGGWLDDGNPDSIRKSELEEWMNEGVIDFLGKLDDVRPALSACSVFVLPSYREGTPRSVLEAMAIGRAIITTDAPGCRETVFDGDNGFIVPVKSVDELALSMMKFINEPSLVGRMGARSRQIACEKYDVHMVNAHMMRSMGIRD